MEKGNNWLGYRTRYVEKVDNISHTFSDKSYGLIPCKRYLDSSISLYYPP